MDSLLPGLMHQENDKTRPERPDSGRVSLRLRDNRYAVLRPRIRVRLATMLCRLDQCIPLRPMAFAL